MIICDLFQCATRTLTVTAAFICSMASLGVAKADITLPKLFSDHMVLQRNSEVPVWGTAAAGEKLKIKLDQTEYSVTASDDGKWSTVVRTGDAGGPFELSISAVDSDLKVGFTNVMIGDVWICSGQSNMEWPVSKALNPDTEIEKAKNSKNSENLRFFTIENSSSPAPLDEFGNVKPWAVCGADSVASFSAVGYFFGREIQRSVDDIPIGLIDATWGGTRCEAWTSRNALESNPKLAPLLEHWDSQKEMVTSPNHPANLYNAMIAPMTKFPVRGVIWYQGEANVGRGDQYRELFPTMIKDWRAQFGAKDLPFYFVQLAPFDYEGLGDTALAELWDAQLVTAKTVANTGMAVTADIGNLTDIHPRNKQAVGQRLAMLARKDLYGDDSKDQPFEGPASGPLFESISTNGSKVRVTFQHTGKQLRIRGQGDTLTGFAVCGKDKIFHAATARIVDNVVVELECESVPEPVAVRFGWDRNAQMNLTNEAGLPASPFRSDSFALPSQGKHF